MPLRLACLLLIFVAGLARADNLPVVQQGSACAVEAVAFSPDGARFAVGAGYSISIVESATGMVQQHWATRENILSLAWSPDGGRLAAGGVTYETGYAHGAVEIWDGSDGHSLQRWRTGPAGIRAIAWSPVAARTYDAPQIATATGADFEGREDRGGAALWSDDGRLLHTLVNYVTMTAALAWSPDGRRLALSYIEDTGGQQGSAIYSTATGRALAPPQRDWFRTISFTANGALARDRDAAAVAADGTLWLTTAAGSKKTEGVRLELRRRNPTAAPAAPGQLVAQLSLQGDLQRAFLSGDGNWLVTTLRPDYDVAGSVAWRCWQLDAARKTWREAGAPARYCTTLPFNVCAANHRLAVAMVGGTLVWNLQTGLPEHVLPGIGNNCGLAFDRDARRLAAGYLWDLSGAAPRRGREVHGDLGIALSPDGKRAIRGGLIDTTTGQGIGDLEYVDYGAFAADGTALAVIGAHSSHDLHLARPDNGQILRRVDALGYPDYRCVAFAPTGHNFIAAGVEHLYTHELAKPLLALFDGATGQPIRRFATEGAPRYAVYNMVFAPGGTLLATSGMTGAPWESKDEPATAPLAPMVRFWDVATGTPQGALPVSNFLHLPCAAFISDEVCAVSMPEGVQFWRIARSHLVKPPRLLAQLTVVDIDAKANPPSCEWLVTTPSGRWDASPGAARLLRWRVHGAMQTTPPTPATAGLLRAALN